MSAEKTAGQLTGIRSLMIYTRIPADAGGTGSEVSRQLGDCRKLAADRDWPVGDEIVDIDVFAFSGKRRCDYESVLADLASRSRDAVIVYNLDRLHRCTSEFKDFVSL